MELLIKKAQKGDAEAFIQLMQLHEGALYNAAKSILANEADIGDALQETILAAYKSLHTSEKPIYFKTWLTRILINKCKDIIKANQRVTLLENYAEEGHYDAITQQLEIDACLDQLSDTHQEVLDLYYHQGFNTREISALLGENENTIRSRLTRAKRYFRDIFIKSEKGDPDHEK